jgi:hypothetical protein
LFVCLFVCLLWTLLCCCYSKWLFSLIVQSCELYESMNEQMVAELPMNQINSLTFPYSTSKSCQLYESMNEQMIAESREWTKSTLTFPYSTGRWWYTIWWFFQACPSPHPTFFFSFWRGGPYDN